jgi:hypothetical protein
MRWAGHVARMVEKKKRVYVIGRKAIRKETARKTET